MKRWLSLLLLAACAVTETDWEAVDAAFKRPAGPFGPRTYHCLRAPSPMRIDGDMGEWFDVAWTTDFVDITTGEKPRHRTHVKMLWDDERFYILAVLDEPHVQASFTQRDSFIYHDDNDFEVFLDPDDDTHDYFELEINALNTVWDLFLVKPYRDGGPALHGFDLAGLKTAVAVKGTLNDPSDTDRGWIVEIAIPWKAFSGAAGRPEPGDRWRVNFSRVQWRFRDVGGKYVKASEEENNWVWSQQGVVAMHYPERWGFVQFGHAAGRADLREEDKARARLREIYYRQRGHKEIHGRYYGEGATRDSFVAWEDLSDGRRLLIREDGWVGEVER